MSVLHIGNSREVFWDDYLIDPEQTTAFHRVLPPERKEICFTFDAEQWLENCSISYPCILKDEKGYRMYYSPWTFGKKAAFICICVIESQDGIHWTRPNLNIYPHPELPENNVVLEPIMDSAFVFYDTNPACPPEQKYKAVGQAIATHNGQENVHGLWCWTSPDGYRFTLSHLLSTAGHFDSLNTMFWKDGKYYCYFRSFHNIDPNLPISNATRDVRVMWSEDLFHWSEPQMIFFQDSYDIPLYTNNVIPYDRAPQVFVGFPVRYCERPAMTENIRQFPSYDIRIRSAEKCEYEVDKEREPLVGTDSIFMCSRDGVHWYRYNEAFLACDLETEDNWIYGDCYLAYHWVDPGDGRYYLYEINRHFHLDDPKQLIRYTVRKDGFACMMAGGEEAVIVTKPLIFSGSRLHLNFASSAYGSIHVRVLAEDGTPISGESYEMYGNSIDKICAFPDGTDFSPYAGTLVRLQFRMRDAKLFSMRFE